MRTPTLLLVALALAGCGGSDSAKPPPVIVLEDPEGAVAPAPAATAADYAGVAWEQAGVRAEAAVASGEPAELVALLREYEPTLTDPPMDAQGDNGWDDLTSALVTMDTTNLYGRVRTRDPMSVANDTVRELRFWLEQDGKMVTVEVKVGGMDSPCEVLLPDTAEAKLVNDCHWVGRAVDLRIPLSTFAPAIDVTKPYWASGFQTCCVDAERSTAYDEIAEAQEVWRIPAGVETGAEPKPADGASGAKEPAATEG